MASKILLHKGDLVEIYKIMGIPKNKENPTVNKLLKLMISIQTFHINDLIPKPDYLFYVDEPNIDLVKEGHLLFKQLIQLKVNEGFIAINLNELKDIF